MTPPTGDLPYLDPIPFQSGVLLGDETFPLVAGFTCHRAGQPETRFERDVSAWITGDGPEDALESTRVGKAEVRIFCHEDGRVIGYAALGGAEWLIAEQRVPVWLLHYFGVHTQFLDEKPADYRQRYGRRIFGGVLEEVMRRGQPNLLALYVDPDNPAGDVSNPKAFYPSFRMNELDREVDGDRVWVRMVREVS